MTWTHDYETINNYRYSATERIKAQMERALEYARGNVTGGYDKDEDDFIVIRVEGYDCIALITDEFTPIEIAERIFPFDEERIYPMQGVETVVQFKRY